MTTPAKLREWRLANGLTQTEAAASFGKSLRTYQNYEAGSTALPGKVLDALILASAAHQAARRQDEQALNEAAIAKVEALPRQPRKVAGTPFDASGWGLPKPVVTPEPLPDHWAKLPEAPDSFFDDDPPEDD